MLPDSVSGSGRLPGSGSCDFVSGSGSCDFVSDSGSCDFVSGSGSCDFVSGSGPCYHLPDVSIETIRQDVGFQNTEAPLLQIGVRMYPFTLSWFPLMFSSPALWLAPGLMTTRWQ